MSALANPKLKRTVVVFSLVVIFLLVLLAYDAFIAKAQDGEGSTQIAPDYSLVVSTDPFSDELVCVSVFPADAAKSAVDACVITGGTTRATKVSDPVPENANYTSYWVQIDRQGILALDVHCHVLIPQSTSTADPRITCLVF